MNKREFFYPSTDGKTEIHAVCWEPDDILVPKGSILIAHGVTEYIMRYEAFAKYMTDAGYLVAGNDIIGHGRSIAPEGTSMYLGGKGSWNYLKEDLLKLKTIIYSETSKRTKHVLYVPYYILGFSMGSFILRDYLMSYPCGDIDGAIILGTGQTPRLQIALANWIANQEGKKYGDDQSTAIIRQFTFGTYNKAFAPNKTEFDWLCANEDSIAEYVKDPQRGDGFTSGLFRELLYGMSKTGTQKLVNKMNKNIPVLFLSGMEDSVGEKGKGVKRAYNSFQKAGMKNVEMKLYPEMRHDILHEKQWENVAEDIVQWIENHAKS